MRLLLFALMFCFNGAMQFNFDWSGIGSGGPSLFDQHQVRFNFTHNVGSVTYRTKEYTALAYYTQQMGNYSNYPHNLLARWIDIIAVANDGSDLLVLYIGCHPVDTQGQIAELFVESLTQTLTYLKYMHGNCAGFIDHSISVAPAPFPALLATPTRNIRTGIVIVGPQIGLDIKGDGWLITLGQNMTTHMLSTGVVSL
jgi:hypothetical protein